MTPGERAIWEELRRMSGLIEQLLEQSRPSRFTDADRVTLQPLLIAIREAFGDSSFVVADFSAASVRAPALQRAVAESGLNAHQIGNLFARAAGEDCGGWAVKSHGLAGSRVVWAVSRSLETSETARRAGVPRERAIGSPQLTSD